MLECYNPSLDSFYIYLVDLPRKIIWMTFLDNSVDVSKAYDKFMRALTITDVILLVLSYIHSFETHVVVYDKLLRVLTTSKWSDLILNVRNG